MIIRSESFLPVRNIPVHEAAQYVLGVAFGLPMDCPEVFRDKSGGRAPFDQPALAASASGVVIEDIPGDELRLAAIQIGAVFLAGCAAEAIAANVDTSIIIGSRTQDLQHAVECIRKVGQSDLLLEDAWRMAVKMLHHAWPMVLEIAQDIPITDGTHRPPKFH